MLDEMFHNKITVTLKIYKYVPKSTPLATIFFNGKQRINKFR